MSKYRVISREWDHNGTLTVEVACPFPRTAKTDAGVRRAARAALKDTKRTRILRWSYDEPFGLVATAQATRLED